MQGVERATPRRRQCRIGARERPCVGRRRRVAYHRVECVEAGTHHVQLGGGRRDFTQHAELPPTQLQFALDRQQPLQAGLAGLDVGQRPRGTLTGTDRQDGACAGEQQEGCHAREELPANGHTRRNRRPGAALEERDPGRPPVVPCQAFIAASINPLMYPMANSAPRLL